MRKISLLLVSFLFLACVQNSSTDNKVEEVQGEWIKGDADEKLEIIEEHFQGFGKAMWEVSYRYKELYVAGMDENWEYAEHHVEEMEEAIELGLQRRPKHAKASEHFLQVAIPEIEKAIEAKNRDLFEEKFEELRQSCNACHMMRDHEFIKIKTPKDYYSVVGEEK